MIEDTTEFNLDNFKRTYEWDLQVMGKSDQEIRAITRRAYEEGAIRHSKPLYYAVGINSMASWLEAWFAAGLVLVCGAPLVPFAAVFFIGLPLALYSERKGLEFRFNPIESSRQFDQHNRVNPDAEGSKAVFDKGIDVLVEKYHLMRKEPYRRPGLAISACMP